MNADRNRTGTASERDEFRPSPFAFRPSSRRRRARESVVEALYQLDLMLDPPEQVERDIIRRKNPSREVEKFFRRLFERTVAERTQIDVVLAQVLKKWKLYRLSYVDRAVLRMACCELLFFDEIPTIVAINEAIELAKDYAGQESAWFVNGVLDAIARRFPKTEKQPRMDANERESGEEGTASERK